MDQPATPIQALQAWLAAQTPGAALAAVPVGVLLEHFLRAQQQGSASAGHELLVLGVLVEHWLKRMQADIRSFPLDAVPVLSEQKRQLLLMHQALSDLQQCLQNMRSSQGASPRMAKPLKPMTPPAARSSQRPSSWQRGQSKAQVKNLAQPA
jgi:hypothetical protein